MGPKPVTASMRRWFDPIELSLMILTRPDVAGGPHVGAAAQLGRVRAGLEHPDDVAVLVAEEGDGPELLGEVLGRLVVADRLVGQDLVVGQVLDLDQLVGRHRLVVAEVEAQPVGGDQRALLLDVLAQHLAQRPVQQVGGGVVAADGVAALDVDGGGDQLAGLDLALDARGPVAVQARAARRWCRAPRPDRSRSSMVPVSPT